MEKKFDRRHLGLGAKALKEKHGSDHFKKIGSKGGKSTYAKHGSEHFAKLAESSNAARRMNSNA